MIHYFVVASTADIDFLHSLGVTSILVSYHYVRKKNPQTGKVSGKIIPPSEIKLKYPNIKDIFLDCGAFSSIMSGKEIDVKAYTDFCLDEEPYYTLAVALDPLWDRARITAGTYENYVYAYQRGCKKVIPVWHGNEKMWYVLEEYCKLSDYIAIGSACRRPAKIRLFREFPNHRFHGFAQTDWWGMLRFPWWSADSSTWAKTPAYGFKIEPGMRKTGKKHGYGVSDLLDSKVNPFVRHYKNRRTVFVLDMLRSLDIVETRFGNWKYISQFKKTPDPFFQIEEDSINEDLSIKVMRNKIRWVRREFMKSGGKEENPGQFELESVLPTAKGSNTLKREQLVEDQAHMADIL